MVPVDTSWPLVPAIPPPARVKVDPVFSSAIDEALEEALRPPPPPKVKGATKKEAGTSRRAKAKKRASGMSADQAGGKALAESAEARADPGAVARDAGPSKRKRSTPPPAVNEPLAFINFVAAFAVGSTIDGEVVSFTSHGAMVDVPLPAGGVLHCYIPLTAMGSPPPTKARQVLKRGEVRPFVLAGLDPPRRVAELTLPPVAVATLAERPEPAGSGSRKAVPKKAASKQIAKKAVAAKNVPAAKKVPAKQVAAKKAPVKRAPGKKAAATKKAAKKAVASKKAANKAAVSKRSLAKKATATKAEAATLP